MEFAWKNSSLARCDATSKLPVYGTSLPCDVLTLEYKPNLAFAAVHIFLATIFLLLAIWTYSYRSYTLLKVSQWKLLIVMIAGCIIANLYFISRSYLSTTACMLQPMLLVSGISLSFGALLVRVYKSWRIFDNPSLKKRHFSTVWTMSRVFAIFAFECGICTVWWIVDPLTPTTTQKSLPGYTSQEGAYQSEKCASDSTVWETLIAFSFSLFIIMGLSQVGRRAGYLQLSRKTCSF